MRMSSFQLKFEIQDGFHVRTLALQCIQQGSEVANGVAAISPEPHVPRERC